MTLEALAQRPLLVYGIGNIGRQDDGLGPLVVEQLAARGVPAGVTLESAYQLAPEDALLLSTHAAVVFVDATAAADARHPYALSAVAPASEIAFTTHALSPGALLTLCRRLYGAAPAAFALALPARGFEVNAPLSDAAVACLDRTVQDLHAALTRGEASAPPLARRV